MSARSAHTIHRFNGLSSFMKKVALTPQSAERVLVSYRRVTATNVSVNWALRVVQTKMGHRPRGVPTYQQLDLLVLVDRPGAKLLALCHRTRRSGPSYCTHCPRPPVTPD